MGENGGKEEEEMEVKGKEARPPYHISGYATTIMSTFCAIVG